MRNELATQWAAEGSIPGRRKSLGKGPEAGEKLPNSRTVKEGCVTRARRTREK